MDGDFAGRRFHIHQVWITALVQGRRHTNQQSVRFRHPAHVSRGYKLPLTHTLVNPLRRNVLDVTFAGLQLLDLLRIHVKTKRLKAGGDKGTNQRQAHVTQPDHPNLRRLLTDRSLQSGSHRLAVPVHCSGACQRPRCR